jgi:hypothetical protein
MARNDLLDGVPSSHLHVLRSIAYALESTLQSWARTRWSKHAATATRQERVRQVGLSVTSAADTSTILDNNLRPFDQPEYFVQISSIAARLDTLFLVHSVSLYRSQEGTFQVTS